MTKRTVMRPFFTTHGKEWLLNTSMSSYFILLADGEIDELTQMMDEATVLREVDQLVNTHHRLG